MSSEGEQASAEKAKKASNFAVMVEAEDLGYKIPVFHKKNESPEDALERVRIKHQKKNTQTASSGE
jgi:hypothetical protein